MSEQPPGAPGDPTTNPATPPPAPEGVPTQPVPTPAPRPAEPAPADGGGNRTALIGGAVILVLILVGAFLLLNQGGGASPAATASAEASTEASEEPTEAPTEEPTEAPTEEPTEAPTPTPDACAPQNLALITPGVLTFGADNPAYPPYFEPSTTNPDPWELGDPTNGQGFEGAVAAALAEEMGFSKDTTTWVVAPFTTAIGPGAKDFDVYISQVSYTEKRAQAVDLSDGYYDVTQSVVAAKDSPLAQVTTISGLKDFTFGAQVGTTSYDTITGVIAPSKDPKVYDTNDLAVKALKNGQIDGLVVDLPTAFYVTAVQFPKGVIVGQFAPGADAEHFSMVLDKGSPLTACVNAAIGRLKDSGQLEAITKEWLADKADAPLFQP